MRLVFLRGSLCSSVVDVFLNNFATETQRSTEDAQRKYIFPTDSEAGNSATT